MVTLEDDQIIGIIGGTGLGDSLSKHIIDGKLVDVDTPYGKPADKILVGRLGNDRKIAFLNRHGAGHKFPPSKIPYAANMFAMKELGVRTIISMGAVGSLNEEIAPGEIELIKILILSALTFKPILSLHCIRRSSSGRSVH